MLLQSQHEHATAELLIIAAGLSIQDPRERPLEQKEAATAAHKQFFDPQSAFLSLLNIWNAVHEEWDQLRTQGQWAVAGLGANHKTKIILALRTINLTYLSCSFSVLKNDKSQRTPAQPSGVALW
jgi:HrpA-like RNA helicase